MQVGYNNMHIRCNQKFNMFCKDQGIDFMSGSGGDTPSIFGDFHFTIRHYEDSHFTALWTEKSRLQTLQSKTKLRCTKNYFHRFYSW